MENRDWSELPTDIVEQFYKRLTNIPDQVRFGSVCKTWHSSSTSNKACHWVPHTPWLISNDETTSQFHLFSNSDNKLYKIEKPFNPSPDAFIMASLKGWLVIPSKPKPFILNLFSKIQIDLPHLSSLYDPTVDNCFGMDRPLGLAISTCDHLNPITVAMVTFDRNLACCQIGDNKWRRYWGDEEYANVAFHNGKLYAIKLFTKNVDIFQVDQGVLVLVACVHSRRIRSQPFEPMDVYLVECGERVLVVMRYYDSSKLLRPTIDFLILEVEEKRSTSQLVRVDSLEDYVLFVAGSNNCESLEAKYCPGFRSGCVYFTECVYFDNTNFAVELVEYSVSDGTMRRTPLTNPQFYCSFWVLPRFALECDCFERSSYGLGSKNEENISTTV
ncbi:F-box-like domain superfamily [Sesbania bispinosa]|nr:F-box-like domain superfamily [Sesbania bispinosa]